MRSLGARAGLGLLTSCLIGHSALAIVIRPGSAHDPTLPPPDDPGFASVGTIARLSGVYLGRGWVLTAGHVVKDDRPILRLADTDYPAEAGSVVHLETRPGQAADLALFRLERRPPLPSLVIARDPPQRDEIVTLIGNGWTARPDEVFWDAQWKETSPARAVFSGLVRGGPGVLRWGRNAVTWADRDVPYGELVTQSFHARFDRTGGPAEECTVSTGDSGGGAFVKRDGRWELIGILIARGEIGGQPGNVVAFGNPVMIADLSHYRAQIREITGAADALRLLLLACALAVTGLAALWLRSVIRRRRAGRAGPTG